jgi:hypothetical protein
MGLDDLSEAERSSLRAETLARLASRKKDRVGESVQTIDKTTPHKETTNTAVVSPTSSDPYGLPTLEEGLAYRLGLDEKKAAISDDTRRSVMEQTVGKFNAIMGMFGASPVKLDEASPLKGKSSGDKRATAAKMATQVKEADRKKTIDMLADARASRIHEDQSGYTFIHDAVKYGCKGLKQMTNEELADEWDEEHDGLSQEEMWEVGGIQLPRYIKVVGEEPKSGRDRNVNER